MSFFLVSQGYQDNLTGFTCSTGGNGRDGSFPPRNPLQNTLLWMRSIESFEDTWRYFKYIGNKWYEKPRVLHGFSPPGGLLVVLHRDQLLAMAASGTTSSMVLSENRVPHGAPPVISHHLPKVEVWCCRIWGYTDIPHFQTHPYYWF